MSLLKIFKDFIADGTWTKQSLTDRLNQIKSYNTPSNIILTDDEYNEILQIINQAYPG